MTNIKPKIQEIIDNVDKFEISSGGYWYPANPKDGGCFIIRLNHGTNLVELFYEKSGQENKRIEINFDEACSLYDVFEEKKHKYDRDNWRKSRIDCKEHRDRKEDEITKAKNTLLSTNFNK